MKHLILLRQKHPTHSPAALAAVLVMCILLLASCQKSNEITDASGAFESVEITVSAEVGGKIIDFPLAEGDAVEKDQFVVGIDTIQLELHKKQLEASNRGAEANRPNVEIQIAVIRQQLNAAYNEQRRIRNLYNAGAASKKQYDDINANVAVLEKQLAAQQVSLQKANAGVTGQQESIYMQIAQIEDQIRRASVVSPITGVILVKYANAGELASPGKPLFKVADLERLTLRAYITADQLSAVKLGDTVRVYADSGKDGRRQYDGVITYISEQAEFTPKTIQTRNERANMVYAVKITVENDGYLKLGMYGGVDFAR